MKVKSKSSNGSSPGTDGVDHINIHPKARTALGRLLSFYKGIPFVHPQYGPFYSIEGFSHFLRTGCKHDELRYVHGFEAKKLGKAHTVIDNITAAEFRAEIMFANYVKITSNTHLLEMLISSELRFDSYYTFGPSGIVVDTRESSWFIPAIEEMREYIKKGEDPPSISGLIARYQVQ